MPSDKTTDSEKTTRRRWGCEPETMTPIDTCSLSPIESRGEHEPYRARLLLEGHPTSLVLDGHHLESQLRTRAGHALLFVTDDCPYEEQLHIFLLSDALEVLDSLTLGRMYQPGVLRDLSLTDRDQLGFAFS